MHFETFIQSKPYYGNINYTSLIAEEIWHEFDIDINATVIGKTPIRAILDLVADMYWKMIARYVNFSNNDYTIFEDWQDNDDAIQLGLFMLFITI